MTDLPDIKLKAVVNFPAQVFGRTGIDVVQSGGNFYLDLDYGDFAILASPPPNTYTLVYDPVAKTYALAPPGSGGGSTPSNANPLMNGVAAPGASALYSRGDHVHPTDTSLAPINSPAFTGIPTAPNPAPGTNTTQLATTAFVLTNAASAGVSSIGGQAGAITLNGGAMSSQELPAARYDIANTLTTAQRAQARVNIYAAPFDALACNGMQINGSMEVDQVNGGAAIAGLTNVSGFLIDCWRFSSAGTATVTIQQVSDAPPGYTKSLKVTVTTAQAAMGAGDYAEFWHIIEGYRLSRLAFGTASPQPIAIGFWTKMHRTGTYGIALSNGANNRWYPSSFTQNVADTWEFKTVTVPGDVTGAWAIDNSVGLTVRFFLAVGSTYQGAINAWTATTILGPVGATNGVAATTDVFQVTGLIVLPGIELPASTRAPLIMRPFDQEILLCKRHFQKSYLYANAPGTSGVAGGETKVVSSNTIGVGQDYGVVRFPVEMRAAPTVTIYGYSGTPGTISNQAGADLAAASGIAFAVGAGSFAPRNNNAGSLTTTNNVVIFHWAADARL